MSSAKTGGLVLAETVVQKFEAVRGPPVGGKTAMQAFGVMVN